VLWLSVGKSPATAIVRAPVLVVLFKIPVARPDVPALKSVPDVAAEIAVPLPFKTPEILVVNVIAGADVGLATVPVNPFALTTDSVVTVPFEDGDTAVTKSDPFHTTNALLLVGILIPVVDAPLRTTAASDWLTTKYPLLLAGAEQGNCLTKQRQVQQPCLLLGQPLMC